MNNDLWLEKYRPKNLKDYLGNKDDIRKIKDWLLKFDKKKEKCLILTGISGIGKTTLAHLILNECGYNVIEINASEQRSKKVLHTKLSSITKKNILFDNNKFNKSGLILDEMDGICNNSEISGIGEISKLLIKKKIHYPIICTCNSVKMKNIKLLLKHSILVHLTLPTKANILKLAHKIIKKEKINISKNKLEKLILNINDYRKLIYNLYQESLNDIDIVYDNKNLNNLNNNISGIITNFLDNPSYDLEYLEYYINKDSNLYYYNINTNYFYFLKELGLFNNKKEYLKKLFNIMTINFKTSNILYYYMYNKQNWCLYNYYVYIGIIGNIHCLRDNMKFIKQSDRVSYKKKNMILKEYYNLNKIGLEKYNTQKYIRNLYSEYKINNIETIFYYDKLTCVKKKLKSNLNNKDKIINKINNYFI